MPEHRPLVYNMRIGGSCFLVGAQKGMQALCTALCTLFFLQSLLDRGRLHSMFKVYTVAVSSQHVKVDNVSVGRHRLVSLFLKGALRLRPPRAPRAPTWDLPLMLDALCLPPFEPLSQARPGVTLWPNMTFLPKVLSCFHLNQPIQVAQFNPPPQEAEGKSSLLCPV